MSFCDQCEANYTWSYDEDECRLCKEKIPGCLHCDAVETCTRCEKGFTLSPNKLQCSPNSIVDCVTTTPEVLPEGFFQCKKCKQGFYQGWENYMPDQDGCKKKCTDINSNCLECSTDGETCTKCHKGLIPSPDGLKCIE